MERFVSWFVANGGRLSHCAEISADENEQYYVRARSGCTISGGETMVLCPHTLTFNYENFGHSNLGANASKIDRTSLPQDVSLRLLLMEQFLLGEDSFWWPYISILPQPFQQRAPTSPIIKNPSKTTPKQIFHTPLYFDEEDMLWLSGTNLGAATKLRANTWKEEFEAAKNAISGLDKSKQEFWSSDLYIWAATIVTSRSFSSSALQISGLDSPVLVPGIDLLNHSPSAKVTWDWGESACAIQTSDPLTDGNQIFNNYGSKGNEELLMGYGFCLESNQADSFNLSYSPALSQHIDTAKARHSDYRHTGRQKEGSSVKSEALSSPASGIGGEIQLSSDPRTEKTPPKDVKFVMLGYDDYRFSPGFLADCSLALLNGRERNQCMTCTQHDCKFSSITLSRNKLHTLSSIMMILQEKRAGIRKHDKNLPLTPQNKNQEFASIYRSSQLNILEGVLACLSSTLQSIIQLKFEEQPRIVHIQDILTSYPKSLKSHFREVVHAGVGTRDPNKVAKRRGVEFAFAVWLCGLRLLHHSRDLSSTESVLNRWIGFLCAHYGIQSTTEDTESWLARIATASKAQEVMNTAGSYVKAIQAAVEKHPESLYNDEWALNRLNLTWCLVVAREERVRCPTVTESGILGEEDDEFVLVIDLDADDEEIGKVESEASIANKGTRGSID